MSVRAPSAASLTAFTDAKRDGQKKKRLSSGRALTEPMVPVGVVLNDDESEKERLRAEKLRAEEEAHIKKNESLVAAAAAAAASSSSASSSSLPARVRKSLGGKLSSVVGGGAGAGGLLPPVKPMDLKSLNVMFTDCLKLATANKITSKNTWQLDFIRHMGSMLLTKDGAAAGGASAAGGQAKGIFGGSSSADAAADGDENQFQKASCSLDASMMIYSTRVDDVHKSTFKVLGGLSNGGSGAIDEDDEDADGDAAAPGEDAPKKRRARKAGAATLESNPTKLDTKLLETEVEVDPLFHLTTAKFEGGASGMLMNNLSVYSGARLCLDSTEETLLAPRPVKGSSEEEATKVAKQEASLRVNLDLSSFEASLQARLADMQTSLNELRLTSTVDYFLDMRADLEAGGDGSAVQQAEQAAAAADRKRGKQAAAPAASSAASAVDIDLPQLEALPSVDDLSSSFVGGGADGFDQDDEESADQLTDMVALEVAQLDQAIAQEEALNRSIEQAFAQAHLDDDDETEAVGGDEDDRTSARRQRAAAAAAAAEEEANAADYGLLDGLEDMKVNWAGLKHWKFKAKAPTKAAAGVVGLNGKKKRVAKVKEVLDFGLVPFSAVSPAKPASEATKRALLAPYPTNAGERHARQAEISLPEDRFYRLRTLQTLNQKPNVMVKLRRVGPAGAPIRAEAQNQSGDDSQASPVVPATPARDAALQIVPVSSLLSPFARPGDVSLTFNAFGEDQGPAQELQFADGGADDDDHENEGFGGFGSDPIEDDDEEDANPFGGPSAILDLIAAPSRAEKITVSYDRVSKTVDVKALKAAMWSGVNDTFHPVSIDTGRGGAKVDVEQTTFQSAMTRVPEHFPARVHHQLPAVSLSICFISMLHLCNEHGLTLVAPGAHPEGASANLIPDVAEAAARHPEFVRDTAHVKLIGEKMKQAYYLGDFLVRNK